MSYSANLDDELAAIEKSARGGAHVAPSSSSRPAQPKTPGSTDPRRGSSIFAGNAYGNGTNNPAGSDDDDLLVDFPHNDGSGKGKPTTSQMNQHPNSSGRSAPPPNASSKSGVKKSTNSKPKFPKIDTSTMVIPPFGGSRNAGPSSSQSRPTNSQLSHRPPGTGFREKHGDMQGLEQLPPPKQPAPGSKEYRPLVGGFAAAAYEAARADHYAHVDAKKNKVKRQGPLPSI